MATHAPANSLSPVIVVGLLILAWYLYQIASRKREWIGYKVKQAVALLAVYIVGATVLGAWQRVPVLEAAVISGLAGLGLAALVGPPKGGRVPKAVRKQVIARDLTAKGLEWDPSRYHIDHIVPFSRGGDNSPRNLRVVEKQKNLRKGDRMPRPWDFLRK
jgi:HNH endonuclease